MVDSLSRTIIKWVKCIRCGHVGDLHESVYFVNEKQFKLGLQCSQCQSRNVEPYNSSEE